jgi:hypothetical protein
MQAGIVADYIRLVWLVHTRVLARNAACWKKIGAVLHPFMGQQVQPCTEFVSLNKPESLCLGFGKIYLLIDLWRMFRKFGIDRRPLLVQNKPAWRRRGSKLDRKQAIEAPGWLWQTYCAFWRLLLDADGRSITNGSRTRTERLASLWSGFCSIYLCGDFWIPRKKPAIFIHARHESGWPTGEYWQDGNCADGWEKLDIGNQEHRLFRLSDCGGYCWIMAFRKQPLVYDSTRDPIAKMVGREEEQDAALEGKVGAARAVSLQIAVPAADGEFGIALL